MLIFIDPCQWQKTLAIQPLERDTNIMAQNKEHARWYDYVAITTAIIAVLAAIASFRSSTDVSLMLLEKNNANLYQNQANKQWNTYLAQEITSYQQNSSAANVKIQMQAQQALQRKTDELENKVTEASNKAQTYFEKNSNLSTAGTFLEVAIALSAMSVLIKKKYFWVFSLLIAGVGVYFLAIGFL